MFGFSLPKLLVLAAVICAVWYGFRWLSRRGQMIGSRQDDDGPPQVEDMVRCGACGVFYLPDSRHECAR